MSSTREASLDWTSCRNGAFAVCIAGAAKGGPLPNPAGDLAMAGSCWWQRMLSQAQGAEYGKTHRYAAHRALEGGGARRRNSEHSRRLKQSCRSESWRKPREHDELRKIGRAHV